MILALSHDTVDRTLLHAECTRLILVAGRQDSLSACRHEGNEDSCIAITRSRVQRATPVATIARQMNAPCPPAPLWRRLAAMLYDLFPLIGLWMAVAALALALTQGREDVVHPSALYRHGLQVALLGVTAAYFVVSWRRGGQTLGMRAWKLRVATTDGRLGWGMALLRFGMAWVSLLALGAGFLWCLVDRERRAWHDLAAGTRVERLPR